MALNDFPIWLNAAVFAVAGFVVWGAGTRLAVLVDGIARRSGIGHAFLGMLLLGGITSLPEVATVASASYVGNASLAVNNLLGSAAINLVLLAIADAILGRDALMSVVLKPQVPLRRPIFFRNHPKLCGRRLAGSRKRLASYQSASERSSRSPLSSR